MMQFGNKQKNNSRSSGNRCLPVLILCKYMTFSVLNGEGLVMSTCLLVKQMRVRERENMVSNGVPKGCCI